MIKKLKIGLGLLVSSLCVLGAAGSAFGAALTWTADQPLVLSGTGYNLTIKSGSEATSAVVGTSTLAVVIPTSSVFTLTSHQDFTLLLNSGTATTTNTCGSNDLNTLVITSTGTANYTITPNGGVCVTSSGGGGGGGGGGGSLPLPVPAPVVPASNVIPGCNGTVGFSTDTGQSCQFNTGGVTTTTGTTTGSSTSSSTPATYTVAKLGTSTLKNGSKGDSVKELQRVLNKILKTSLVVDGKLGPKTIATIKTWQKAHGLKADGLVGKLTKAAMIAEANK